MTIKKKKFLQKLSQRGKFKPWGVSKRINIDLKGKKFKIDIKKKFKAK